MRRYLVVFVTCILLLAMLVSGCSPGAPTIPADEVFQEFDPANFDNSTSIDNQWLPLKPGTQLVFTGETIERGEAVPHRVVINVTDLTKVIGGVRSVVTWDLDYSGEELVEAELAFFAQDNDGNVWRMGEYPEEYEDGKFVDNPTWIHGLDNAFAGIAMKADPRPGTPDYPQGWGPEVDWTDRGQVDRENVMVCLTSACYENVLVIKETSAQEKGAYQLKYYAPEVGNVMVDWTGRDKTKETLELLEYNTLSKEEMDQVRAEAFKLEKSGFEKSPDVYAQTDPLAQALDVTAVAEFHEFDPGNFSDPTNITNQWMPMQPGTKWAHEGTAVDDEGNKFNRRIEFTVTDLAKEIAGIRTVVAWIVDYNDDEVIEKEIAFYAQDDDGNVWYLGEHPEEFEGGEFVAAPTWIAGIEDAKAGIKMVADPQPGMPSYFQGWGPAVEWSDYGRIDKMGEQTCVPLDCYQDVLVIAESSLTELGSFQYKYYVRDVGEIRVNWGGNDVTQETLELVEFVQLTAEELAEIRAEALALEEHAYEVSEDVYGKTAPME